MPWLDSLEIVPVLAPRSLAFAGVVALLGACLVALPGCLSEAEQPVEKGPPLAFHDEERGVEREVPEWPAPEPGGEPTELPPERPGSWPVEATGPVAEPGPVAIRMVPGSTSPAEALPGGDFASSEPAPRVVEEAWTRSAPAPPMIGPAMVAPRNTPELSEPMATRPYAATVEPRQPIAMERELMTAPAAVPKSAFSDSSAAPRSLDLPEAELPAIRSDLDHMAMTAGGDPVTAPVVEPVDEAGSREVVPRAAMIEPGEGDYHVVKVFYGTDRNDVKVLGSEARGYLGWFYLTALSAAVTLGLLMVAYRFSQRFAVVMLAGSGVLATVALGVVTTLARLEEKASGPRPTRNYGNERGELEMGICEVSIPKQHERGEVERPSVFRFEFNEDPEKHVVLLDVEEQPADEFFAGLRARIDASGKREAFVFVHGFNFTFEEAAHRTAQLAFDLEFDGAPIFFSWPSQGGLLQYSIDETNVAWAVPHLKEFVTGIARNSGAEAVHLIAHSMGNRALTSALQLLSYEMQNEPPLFREVVLTAPDIDADVFRRDIAPAIRSTADRVTLYASSNDEALRLSKTIHGYRRAGDSGRDLVVIPGVETIDVSGVDTSLLGHDYYGDNTTVLADMVHLINESQPPELRQWLRPMPLGELMYWIFQGPAANLSSAPSPGPSVQR